MTEKFQRYLPYAAAILTAAYFGYCMKPVSDPAGEFAFHEFGRLPVIDGGRFKPLDTVARTNLMILTHRQTYYDYDAEKRWAAGKWMQDVMTTPMPNDDDMRRLFPQHAQEMPAWKHKAFRIENDQLLSLLKLEMRSGLRYSIQEIAGNPQGLNAFLGEVARVRNKPAKQWDLFDSKVAELNEHIQLYIAMSTHGRLLMIPGAKAEDQWTTFREAHDRFAFQDKLPDTADARAYLAFRKMLVAYQNDEKRAFNEELSAYLKSLEASDPARMRVINAEVFFNDLAPFYHALEVYVVAAILCLISFLFSGIYTNWTRPIQWSAFAMMCVAFGLHAAGFVFRMYLQDRMFVFVTNLYSSAVFIGFGAVLFGIVLELYFKNGIATLVGAACGFCSLIIGHMLSLSGDTLEMMQAVLDTNFWLATHVTCITLGYVTTFVAGALGIVYIALGLTTNMLRKDGSANLARMIYGTLCAGMFLSFVGTVLGGLWADYSWGRFWGWDPKENGALLIVIWVALILHARWAGIVKHRGVAVLSVLGIIVTSWSWFGTNFLGVGLHSYGFRQGAMMTLVMFDLLFLAVAGVGMLPLNMWQSFRPLPAQLADTGLNVAQARKTAAAS